LLLNTALGADITTRNGKVLATLNLAVNNITDEAYQNHMSRLKYTAENMVTGRQGVFNMGRNFTARLLIPMRFSLKNNDVN
jgi:iron complex outermembrane recepter protein